MSPARLHAISPPFKLPPFRVQGGGAGGDCTFWQGDISQGLTLQMVSAGLFFLHVCSSCSHASSLASRHSSFPLMESNALIFFPFRNISSAFLHPFPLSSASFAAISIWWCGSSTDSCRFEAGVFTDILANGSRWSAHLLFGSFLAGWWAFSVISAGRIWRHGYLNWNLGGAGTSSDGVGGFRAFKVVVRFFSIRSRAGSVSNDLDFVTLKVGKFMWVFSNEIQLPTHPERIKPSFLYLAL